MKGEFVSLLRIMWTSMKGFTILFFLLSSLFRLLTISTAADTIAATQSFGDGETLVSAGGRFELGFFSLGSRYLGIWYKNISVRTVVWVANGQNKLSDSSGVLKFDDYGELVLSNHANITLWSSNSSRSVQNPVVQLLDNGNLVIRSGNDSDPKNFAWQSFDCPGNTFLPEMKLGRNLRIGLDRYLVSWKSTDDPTPGDYTCKLDPEGFPQLFIRKGLAIVFRPGSWNGLRFSGAPNLEPNNIYTFNLVTTSEEIYYSYELENGSVLSRMVLNPNGELQRFVWVDANAKWVLYVSAQMDDCDRYALCGAYGSCNINGSPPCECLEGFVPKVPSAWNRSDWSNGCARRAQLDCQNDGFIMHSGMKLPDTRNVSVNVSMNLEGCKRTCLSKCNCTAYANSDIRRGTGCLLWYGDLVDIRYYTENGQDLYVRMAASELESYESSSGKKHATVIGITVLSVSMALLFLCLGLHVLRRRKLTREARMGLNSESSHAIETPNEDIDLPLFDLTTVCIATNNFSIHNKIGEGGFGPVYKGKLGNGQEIAVKRLSRSSKQGLDELKSEVKIIAQLQHRNLVKLLGCCIQDEEKILIYEYMPNMSLNSFIFDRNQSRLLDWPTRFHIINGIARGLLYLHQDSRLRIIHRDLKASNILLDNEMNPKISDFGVARSFGGNELEANTSRVIGTYGYMSPEYAIDGIFSVKSDVFSFGVLLIEIVSGKRNRGFQHMDHQLNLLGHVWKLYKEGHSLEIVDPTMDASYARFEVLRSIHVGLLCVQQNPEDRPNMASVVLMLGSENALPAPKQPGFFTARNPIEGNSSSSKQETCSTNEMSLTLLEPR